jgi:hypothetical protein
MKNMFFIFIIVFSICFVQASKPNEQTEIKQSVDNSIVKTIEKSSEYYKEIIIAIIGLLASVVPAIFSYRSSRKSEGFKNESEKIKNECIKIKNNCTEIKNNNVSITEGVSGKNFEKIMKNFTESTNKTVKEAFDFAKEFNGFNSVYLVKENKSEREV